MFAKVILMYILYNNIFCCTGPTVYFIQQFEPLSFWKDEIWGGHTIIYYLTQFMGEGVKTKLQSAIYRWEEGAPVQCYVTLSFY